MTTLQNVIDILSGEWLQTIAVVEALALLWVNLCRLGALTRESRQQASLGQLGLFAIPVVFLMFGMVVPILENKLADNPFSVPNVPQWVAWMLGFQLFAQMMLSYRWRPWRAEKQADRRRADRRSIDHHTASL